MKYVWECDWCNEYISNRSKANVFYDPMYGPELYDPNHPEYSKILRMNVCDACWYKSLYISAVSPVGETVQ